MKERTRIFLKKARVLSIKIVERAELSCSLGNEGRVVLHGWGIAPAEHWYGDLQGKPCLLSDGEIVDLPHGLSREEIEEYLTLNGAENAVFRAIASKAGIPVRTADWWWFNHDQ